MASLRTNYKDDILSGDRKYRMITNSDGTVSFQDVTDYTQEGDAFGALDINATNTAVNALQEANGDTDISGIGDGTNTGAIHTLNTHLSRVNNYIDTPLQTVAMTYDGYFVKNISVTVPTGFEIVGVSFIDYLNSAVIGTVSFKEDGSIECKFLSRYSGNFTFKVRVLLKESAS